MAGDVRTSSPRPVKTSAGSWWRNLPVWQESLVVAAVSVILALLVLQVWRQSYSFPFNYDADGSYYLMIAQGLKRHGSFLTNPDLGYPYGQTLYDNPENLDFLHLTVLWVLTWFGSAVFAVNTFVLLTFATVGGMAHAVLRRLGIGRLAAVVAALLYAFVPYHLQRRGMHLFLSSYWLVPVLVLVALAILGEHAPVPSRRDRGTWWYVAAAVGLAMTGPYYAAFAVLIWLTAGAFAGFARRSWRPVRAAVTLAAVTVTVAVLELLPNLRYWVVNGRNTHVAVRTPKDTEVLGIRLQQLLLPRWDHRFAPLARLGLYSLRGPFLSEGTQALGVVGAVGFLGLLGVAFVGLVRPITASSSSTRAVLLRHLSLLSLAALLFGIGSGFGYFVSMAGLRPIRAYNRFVVVISFCALAALALLAGALAERLAERRGDRSARRIIRVVLAAALLIGLLDQTSPRDATARSSGPKSWEIDTVFYATMQGLPAGSAVLQLPDVSFPETPGVGSIEFYEPVRGYLHQPQLRWSFGSMLGRAPRLPDDLATTRSGADLVAWARAQGFRAIEVDGHGQSDNGAALEARIASTGLVAVARSADDRYTWYDLGPAGGS